MLLSAVTGATDDDATTNEDTSSEGASAIDTAEYDVAIDAYSAEAEYADSGQEAAEAAVTDYLDDTADVYDETDAVDVLNDSPLADYLDAAAADEIFASEADFETAAQGVWEEAGAEQGRRRTGRS